MSPRRSRRRPAADVPAPLGASAHRSEGGWLVRPVTASGAAKTYRCPGCDQEVRPGTPHLVVWRAEDSDDRRHWHTPCWQARERRQVKVHRSKNAPRHG